MNNDGFTKAIFYLLLIVFFPITIPLYLIFKFIGAWTSDVGTGIGMVLGNKKETSEETMKRLEEEREIKGHQETLKMAESGIRYQFTHLEDGVERRLRISTCKERTTKKGKYTIYPITEKEFNEIYEKVKQEFNNK